MVYVYEELTLVCREMESGITETQAYEHFGQAEAVWFMYMRN